MNVVTVWISHPDREDAILLVEQLVSGKLAACGHVFDPGTSIYRWKGKVVKGQEVMILLKTTDSCQKELLLEVKRRHPYEVPEVIFQLVDGGSPEYLSWLISSVSSTGMAFFEGKT